MQSLKLTKMNGAGNSFYIMDLRSKEALNLFTTIYPNQTRKQIAQQLCNESSPDTPTDGMVYILSKPQNSPADFKWDFYNADGSEAEMCGNAARCVAMYTYKNNITPSTLSFETLAGIISAKVDDATNNVDVTMTQISEEKFNLSLMSKTSGSVPYSLVNSGVPHVVIVTNDITDHKKMRQLAQELRTPSYFSPNGANITFLQTLSETHIKSISFERGVEEFTLACGTGAVAAARVHCELLKTCVNQKIEVDVPGGKLFVHFNEKLPHLIGPTELESEIELSPRNL